MATIFWQFPSGFVVLCAVNKITKLDQSCHLFRFHETRHTFLVFTQAIRGAKENSGL